LKRSVVEVGTGDGAKVWSGGGDGTCHGLILVFPGNVGISQQGIVKPGGDLASGHFVKKVECSGHG
jgi:hypothetical protein